MITATVADAKMLLSEPVGPDDFVAITIEDIDLIAAALATCHPATQEHMDRPSLLRSGRVLYAVYAEAIEAGADDDEGGCEHANQSRHAYHACGSEYSVETQCDDCGAVLEIDE